MHPFVLEFCISDTVQVSLDGELKQVSNLIAGLAAQVNFQNRILKLLTAFSNFHFFIPTMEPQWFARIDGIGEEEMNNQTSVVGLNIYQFPKWKECSAIEGFTQVGYPEIEPQEHPDCFQNIELEGKEPVTFSKFILRALHNYFLLSPEQLAAVDSAVELINQGVKLRQSMQSMSFVALISSIETMVAFEYRDMKVEKCKICSADQYKVMFKFRDYLGKYATDDPTAKKRINELYNLRSKIAHTGMLLFGDGKIDFSSGEKQEDQFNMHLQAMMASRLSLINWILLTGKEGKQPPVVEKA
jgi:hypothetical protein